MSDPLRRFCAAYTDLGVHAVIHVASDLPSHTIPEATINVGPG